MKRSLHADEMTNDWYSESLTPVSIKRARAKRIPADLPPTEVDEEVEGEVVARDTTTAIHMDLMERYNQEVR